MNILEKLDPQSRSLITSIGQLAQRLKMKAYLVGGPVRDLLLGHPGIDLDIVVEGNAMRLADEFSEKTLNSMVVKYPAFKTATVSLADGRMIDFASARKEKYARPGAFPAVVSATLKEDLARRDFTINAIAIAINPLEWGAMIDPFKGAADLKAKKIRVLHAKSFNDDPTRILRAVRFKERFGFKIELGTLQLLKEAIKDSVFDTIKPQRYAKEYNKILKEPNPDAGLKCLKSWRILKEDVYAN
jgi:tRNA nucleotidyltransferase (CCA-adding enzyme)